MREHDPIGTMKVRFFKEKTSISGQQFDMSTLKKQQQ